MASNGILLVGPKMQAQATPAAKASGKAVVTDRSAHKTTANIVTYIDYQCPFCEQFETTNQKQIESLVESGKATLEVHPISFLDNSSLGNKYSTRAANAAVCVANYEPDNFYAVNMALYANQPAENTNGKTDAQLLSVLKSAGADSKAIQNCVTSKKFVPWVTKSTATLKIGSQTKVFQGVANTPAVFGGTPTVFVNGEQYSGSLTDPNAFAAFVSANS
jgi:protein-disulfide isomerase